MVGRICIMSLALKGLITKVPRLLQTALSTIHVPPQPQPNGDSLGN